MPEPDLATLAATIAGARYRYARETDLHAGIAAVLTRAGIGPVREVRLTAAERIDLFLPAAGVGIEVKVDGQAGAVWRQLRRYAACPQIRALLLVTTRARHQLDAPAAIDGIPVRVLVLRGGL